MQSLTLRLEASGRLRVEGSPDASAGGRPTHTCRFWVFGVFCLFRSLGLTGGSGSEEQEEARGAAGGPGSSPAPGGLSTTTSHQTQILRQSTFNIHYERCRDTLNMKKEDEAPPLFY